MWFALGDGADHTVCVYRLWLQHIKHTRIIKIIYLSRRVLVAMVPLHVTPSQGITVVA